MAIVDAIAALEILSFDSFPTLPLRNYTQQDALSGETVDREHYVLVHDIVVIDESVDSGNAYRPVTINQSTPLPSPEPNDDDGSDIEGVGSSDLLSLMMLLSLTVLWRLYARRATTRISA